MRSLPFVVQPKRVFSKVKIGTDQTGIVEIERRGYLTVSEKAFVDAVMQGTDAITEVVSLANKISISTGHSAEKTYVSVMRAIQGDVDGDAYAARIRSEYPDEISSVISKLAESVQRRSIAASTILIKSRIDPEWTLEDTLNQDPGLIDALAVFYAEEENPELLKNEAGNESEVESEKESEELASEIVGKSTEENGDN